MLFNELNEGNFKLFAIKNYNNPSSVTYSDFECDLKKFKYIKRLFKRHETTGELKQHLILNHIILLYNVFGDAATPLLFYKIEDKYWSILKSFLLFLDRLPPVLNNNINEKCLKELDLL